jgi:hypothetical protein
MLPLRSQRPSLIILCSHSTVGLDFDDVSSSPNPPTDAETIGRNRAFSFECFAFGINADEPLPPLEHSTSHMQALGDTNSVGRPRGDSIIFDPVSFQDGGIHEQTALEKVTLDPEVVSAPAPTPPIVPPKPKVARPKPEVVRSTDSDSLVPMRTMTTHTTRTNGLPVTSTTTVSTATSTTFSLELLNRDGRIGIYLPEARRARIARFHAKRCRRIWRKRIKYDCRKKLADSRPRIKGRFVKRSDMDDCEDLII